VYIQYSCKKPVSVWPALKWYNKPWVGLQWMFFHKGPAATNHFEGGGFIRSNETVAYPNLQFHFLPVAIRYDGSSPSGGHGYQVHVGPMNSDARGSVLIKSSDPRKNQPSGLIIFQQIRIGRSGWMLSAVPEKS